MMTQEAQFYLEEAGGDFQAARRFVFPHPVTAQKPFLLRSRKCWIVRRNPSRDGDLLSPPTAVQDVSRRLGMGTGGRADDAARNASRRGGATRNVELAGVSVR